MKGHHLNTTSNQNSIFRRVLTRIASGGGPKASRAKLPLKVSAWGQAETSRNQPFLLSCINRCGGEYITLADAAIRLGIGMGIMVPTGLYYFHLISGIPADLMRQIAWVTAITALFISIPHTMVFTRKSSILIRLFLDKLKQNVYCQIPRQELWDQTANLPVKIVLNLHTVYFEIGLPVTVYILIVQKADPIYAVKFWVAALLTILMGQALYFFAWETAVRPILVLIQTSRLLPEGKLDVARPVCFRMDISRRLSLGVFSVIIISLVLSGTLGYSRLKLGIAAASRHIPPESVFSSFFFQMVLIALGTTFIALVLMFFLSRSISIPLGVLSKGIKRVSRGDLDFQVEILSNDELAVVTQGFNYMITERKRAEDELLKARQELEVRVVERTAQLKSANEQLLHAEKLSALGKLAASIAHEFNNPLYGIKMVLEQLTDNANLSEIDLKSVALAIKESDRISRLIRNLQDFYQPSSGEIVPLDVHKAIGEVLEMCKKKLTASGIKVTRDFAEDMPVISAVADQIKQVILNIVNNAEESMASAGGQLDIQTRTLKDKVQIIFKDTGCGIDRKNMKKIFDPFFTTKKTVKGTGLGLSVSYGIIKKHGGNIFVESEPNKGSAFTVELPVKTVLSAED